MLNLDVYKIIMTDQISNNNIRIAKNTLFLYFRMFITMAVSLYTSRVILQVLGVEDYGIYNVTGGVITMFSFVNTAMTSATQRYITFALGKGDFECLKSIFSTALQIHFLISLFIIILGETVGLWFLMNKLVIPESRMTAAMVVYQCSIVASVVSIMSVPYNSDIIAHEKMSAFAYISIFDVFLKLLIVFMLMIIPFDKLGTYAVLLLIAQISIRLIYSWYCNKHFKESIYRHAIDKKLLGEMSNFAGWSFFGNFAYVLYTQGLNMLLNIFFGPVVNAARGIAVQVQGAIQSFAGNFQMAINPQITKNYALNNFNQMHSLMFRSARFSFYLLMYMTLPIILEAHFVLRLWLKTVPDYTVVFVQLMLIITLLNPLASPCTIANQATGKVKVFQIIVGTILMLVLPVSYVVLKLGCDAYSVFIVHFIVEVIAIIARMIILKDLIQLPLVGYIKEIYIPIIVVTLIAVLIPIMVHYYMDEGWLRLLVVSFSCLVTLSVSIYELGLRGSEKKMILGKIQQLRNR